MSLIACGGIHHGYKRLTDDSRGRQKIFISFAALLCEKVFMPIRKWIGDVKINSYFMEIRNLIKVSCVPLTSDRPQKSRPRKTENVVFLLL